MGETFAIDGDSRGGDYSPPFLIIKKKKIKVSHYHYNTEITFVNPNNASALLF